MTKLSKTPDCSRLSEFKVYKYCSPQSVQLFVEDLLAIQFTMTSTGGSSRLLNVCCCVSFVSVFLYCIGYVRLELEMRAYKERLEALEQREKKLVATPSGPSIPTNGECIKVCLNFF